MASQSAEVIIRQHIETYDYITIDQFMRLSLSSQKGYYRLKKNIIGAEGDFITAPEISQMFGEMIGIWCTLQYQKLGFPKRINVVELGPGRGVLMRDLVKAAKLDHRFYQALEINLLEINPHFKDLQKTNLIEFSGKISWIDNIENLPLIPTIYIANEFFDALAVKQYIKLRENWYERVIVTNNNILGYEKIAISSSLNKYFLNTYKEAECGAIIERRVEGEKFISRMAKHFSEYSGGALVIDYGYEISPQNRKAAEYNSTLQAVKKHKFCDILKNLGNADLSAHVDFYRLTQIAKTHNISICPLTTQRDFLIKYGIEIRKAGLQQNSDNELKQILEKQVERLLDPLNMGSLFKVLEFYNHY